MTKSNNFFFILVLRQSAPGARDMRVAATGRSGVSRGASLTVGVAIPEESGRVRDCSSRCTDTFPVPYMYCVLPPYM